MAEIDGNIIRHIFGQNGVVKSDKAKTRNNNKPVVMVPAARKPDYDFQLGRRVGNTRVIGEESVSTVSGNRNYIGNIDYAAINERFSFRGTSSSANSNLNNPNGVIDTSNQGHRGDCFYLAEINAIRNTRHGQEILRKNVTLNSDGSFTIKLPGAAAVRKNFEAKGLGNKCEITGTYQITAAAIEKARNLAGQSYSSGDIEVIALELAMESYRAELAQTLRNTAVSENAYNAEGGFGRDRISNNDYMDGGYAWDAGFILTGQKSDAYVAGKKKHSNLKLYNDGQYGYISRAEMESQGMLSAHTLSKGSGTNEISHLTHEEAGLNNMLNKYKGHEKEYALVFSVRCAKNGPDGKTKAGGYHAITVVKITDDIIYVANPWHPDKIEPIPRRDFLRMCDQFVAQRMDVNQINQNYAESGMGSRSNRPSRRNNSVNMDALFARIRRNGNNRNRINIKGQDNFDISNKKIDDFLEHYNAQAAGMQNIPRVSFDDFNRMVLRMSRAELSDDIKDKVREVMAKISAGNTASITSEDLRKFNDLYQRYGKA